MNIDFKLKLPIINEETSESNFLTVSAQLMLKPLYALESDVISPFEDLDENSFPWIRKLLFNASLTVYRLTNFLEGTTIISEQDLFLLRRDFVICIVTNEMSKQLNKDLAASLSRSKTLGDFSVSTSKKGDSSVLLQLIKDSSDCIAEMKQTIEDLQQSSIIPATFVKGQYNPKTKLIGRLWWHTELPVDIKDGFASKKYHYNGDSYKAGTFNIREYSRCSHFNTLEFYKALASGQEIVSKPGHRTQLGADDDLIYDGG